MGTSYDDADRPVSMSLPATGDLPVETLTYAYNDGTDGGLSSLTSSLTTPTSTLFQQPTYTSQGLLSGWQSGVASGNPAWQASVALGYDGDLRVTDSKLTRTDTISGLSLPIAEVQPSYDAVGNVSSVTTTLAAVGTIPGGSETQAFCYDDLDRLTWAGTSGTGPCGRAGSEGIAGAGYTASYAYDTFDRITSASVLTSSGVALSGAAQGTYSYGASGHLHAVSSVGTGATGYSAAYDAAGELTCRAVGASTCTNATPTGQALGYDALRRLISWQDATTSPTATGAYAYDGSGSRVWQQDTSTSGGVTTTTTTTYILGIAEITSVQIGQAATTTAATRFYPLAGGVSALRDAAGLSYVASDQLGTPIATLNLDTGAVLGEQLRAPYGQARYAASAATNGGMRTTYGFTGQREDATAAGSSGLDYFNARYYDPIVGRFTSPDSVMGSDALLDDYAYVGGQVESATDPSGHDIKDSETIGVPFGDGEGDGEGIGGGGGDLLSLTPETLPSDANLQIDPEGGSDAWIPDGDGTYIHIHFDEEGNATLAEGGTSGPPPVTDETGGGAPALGNGLPLDTEGSATGEQIREAEANRPSTPTTNDANTTGSSGNSGPSPTVQQAADENAAQQAKLDADAAAKGQPRSPCATTVVCENPETGDVLDQSSGKIKGNNQAGLDSHGEAQGKGFSLRSLARLGQQGYGGSARITVITGKPFCPGCVGRIPSYAAELRAYGGELGIDVEVAYYAYGPGFNTYWLP